jgi:acetyl-CoA acetyltransferase
MFPIRIKRRKGEFVLTEDEGVFPTTMESLAKLKPIIENGIHTFGSQTHPADGNAGIIVTNREHALEIGKDKNIPVQIVAYGATRTKRAFMPAAPADAAKIALERGGVSAKDLKSVKNHTPFIVNDLHFAKELGLDKKNINNYGTSMVFGHPQGPTMGRLLIEAIEETVIKGGGYALVAGCAAGDNAAALLVKIG